jgi:beta-glucanase (GH16 family)
MKKSGAFKKSWRGWYESNMAGNRVRQLSALVFALVFATIIGVVLLHLTMAGTATVALEAESGTLGGSASSQADGSASNGRAVKFQQQSTDNPGTGTPGGPLGAGSANGPSAAYNKLIFDDEFNGTTLDTNKWQTCNPAFTADANFYTINKNKGECRTPYNTEQQIFRMSNSPDSVNPNIKVNGGILHMIATKENGQVYSSMISTGRKIDMYDYKGFNGFGYTYGYFEGRAKFARGNGFWPSFWMRPFDVNANGGWPNNGEYDIVEVLGGSSNGPQCAPRMDPTKVVFTRFDNTTGANPDTQCFTVADTSADYHTYGFEWAPGVLKWYFDGKLMRTINNGAIKNYPFYLTANFSLCAPGGFGGPCDGSTPFPSEYDVDYMRVFQNPNIQGSTQVHE